MKWTEEEIELLAIFIEQGYTHQDIANELGRTVSAVKNKTASLKLVSLNNKKKSTEQFISEMKSINPDIEILGEYVNNKTKIKCKCLIDGYVWYPIPSTLLGNIGCPRCSNKEVKNTKQFIEEIKIINPNIKILGEYINSKTKIRVKCLICGNIWEIVPNHLLRKRGCPVCAKRNHGGSYQRMTKAELDNLGYPLYLYKVRLQYEDEIFYKFGLTMNEDRSRYYNYKPYKVIEELSFEEYDAWTAKCTEAKLISNYEPIHHFGGWTECYRE